MPIYRPPEYGRAVKLVHDAETAGFTLPPEVAAACTTAETLVHAKPTPLPPDPTNDHRNALLDAARDGEDLPGYDDLTAFAAAELGHRRHVAALDAATEEAMQTFVYIVGDNANTIIVDGLRPALTDLWPRVVAEVGKLGAGRTAAALFNAPDKARKAWTALDDHAIHYGRLRSAYATARAFTGSPNPDTSMRFAQFRNAERLYTAPSLQTPEPRPLWPEGTTGAALLAWLVDHDADPWMPDNHDLESRWAELYNATPGRMTTRRNPTAMAR